MAETTKVWKYEYDPDKLMPLGDRQAAASAEWKAFIEAMRSGEQFECDETMYYYWLEVLPPVHYSRWAELPNGENIHVSFGFAEGAEEITVFWATRTDGQERYF